MAPLALGASRATLLTSARAPTPTRTTADPPPSVYGSLVTTATAPGRPFLLTGEGWPYLLVPLIPVAVLLELTHAGATWVFLTSALGVVPTAALMGKATEELAARSGPGIGGFLNVTFGNAPELIIALFALGAGLHEVVKASLVGSILGNVLLVMGASMLAGGLGRDRQEFEPRAASAQALLLLLATVALIMPAIYALVGAGGLPDATDRAVAYGAPLPALSVGVAVVLLLSYGAGLVFSLKTHRDLFNPAHDDEEEGGEPWSVRRSVLMLALAGVAVGVMSEILVGSIVEASATIGLSPFFVGVIVVAIVGNAAEHWVSVYFAMRDKIDMSINIAIGSAAQIALFVAPVLVLSSFAVGPFPMALVFNGFEIGAIFLAVFIAQEITQRGDTTWFEGVQLLAVYAVLGLTFFFVR